MPNITKLTLALVTYLSFNTMSVAQSQKLISFNLNDYIKPVSDPIYWKEIYNGETIRAGYYHLKANAKDDQSPHDYDEVYWIERGKSKIRIGTQDFNVGKGDVIYVQAKQVHYFHEITEDLDILVLFAKGPFDANERIDQINNLSDLETKRSETENIWNDFLKKKSMTFGLYMLPKATGGDDPLTHQFDEINFVVKGWGKFKAGEEEIEVKPGSLFYVQKNTPHYFDTPEGIDVFILFERKSVQP